MNLILFNQKEWLSHDNDFSITLSDRRAEHIIKVIRPSIGDTLRIGLIDGNIGTAVVETINSPQVSLYISPALCKQLPPKASSVKLILALPRPKVARRIVRTASEFGIKSIHFINSFRVEKSYWQSPLISSEKLHEQIILGLEQSVDTTLPHIHTHNRFKPFVEDTLPMILAGDKAIVAHPYTVNNVDKKEPQEITPAHRERDTNQTLWFIIGPEGGFIDYEIEKMAAAGCTTMNFGARIYRTETIVPYLLGWNFLQKTNQ